MSAVSLLRSKRFVIIAAVLATAMIGIQFIRPELTNPPVIADFEAPSEVKQIFMKACYDCHSNADPLRCPKCSREMRIVSLIDEEDVIERILRHLGLWQEGVRVHSGTDPPGETTLDPWLDDPFVAFSAT
jgi:hypothetical protein